MSKVESVNMSLNIINYYLDRLYAINLKRGGNAMYSFTLPNEKKLIKRALISTFDALVDMGYGKEASESLKSHKRIQV